MNGKNTVDCITYVSYLPTVKNGRVRQVKNVQCAGYSKWVLSHNAYAPETKWSPTGSSFYDSIGSHYEWWEPIKNGDKVIFRTTTSSCPIFEEAVWENGNWWAWAFNAPCGNQHRTMLVADPERAEFKSGKFCDNGIFCAFTKGAT